MKPNHHTISSHSDVTKTTEDDYALFQAELKDVKKLTQDTLIHTPQRKLSQKESQRHARTTEDHHFYFSDEYVPLLSEEGPTRYARSDVSKYEVKRLRRGVYVPDVYLDMHGMRQAQAKKELAAMIAYCLKEDVICACVQHGVGKHILKEKVPLWLAQHPEVLAFHQAPLEFGGHGALLVLLALPDK